MPDAQVIIIILIITIIIIIIIVIVGEEFVKPGFNMSDAMVGLLSWY